MLKDPDMASRGRKPKWKRHFAFGVLGIGLAALTWPSVDRHLEAAAFLVRFEGGESTFAGWNTHEVQEDRETFELSVGPLSVRRFRPNDLEDPPVLMIVHGVHHAGMEEPRLSSFARSLAQTGAEVVVPHFEDLTAFEMNRSVVDSIGQAAVRLAERDNRPIGLIGISFGGGLALVAASESQYRDALGFVVSVGGHHDLVRVARWYAGEPVVGPGGEPAAEPTEPYGAAVFAYRHADELFGRRDSAAAEDTLRLLLHDRREEARERAEALSRRGRERMRALLEGDDDETLRVDLLELIQGEATLLGDVSPYGKLNSIDQPVYLLHGVSDPIIPAIESRWLASEIPAEQVAGFVVTPFLRHAEQDQQPSFGQRFELVGFMAAVLKATESLTDR